MLFDSIKVTSRAQMKEIFRDHVTIKVCDENDFVLLNSMNDVMYQSIRTVAVDCPHSETIKAELVRLAELR